METGRVLKYRLAERILHWVVVCSFTILLLTGLVLYLHPLGFMAQDSWTRVIHRIAAVVFVGAPLVTLLATWSASWKSISEAADWSLYDIGWVLAFPRYYFLNDEGAMPPQDRFNTGQKMWYVIVLVFSPLFLITGALMWFFKDLLPSAVFQWSLYIHDISFIICGVMLIVHVYLSALHPLMRRQGGSFRAMVDGTVTTEYAKSHHGKWWDQLPPDKKGEKVASG